MFLGNFEVLSPKMISVLPHPPPIWLCGGPNFECYWKRLFLDPPQSQISGWWGKNDIIFGISTSELPRNIYYFIWAMIFWQEITFFRNFPNFQQKMWKISEKPNFSAKNSTDENRYTLGDVFFDAESDFQVRFVPCITVFCKKSAKKCHFH